MPKGDFPCSILNRRTSDSRVQEGANINRMLEPGHLSAARPEQGTPSSAGTRERDREMKSGGRGAFGAPQVFPAALPARKSVEYLTSAIALVRSTVSMIRRKVMLKLVEEDLAVSMRFINYLLQRNLRMEQNLIDHLFNSSEKRLARTLLLLAHSGEGGHLPAIFKNISQDMLAEMVGTTRSRINFFMNKFRKLGFIHYNGGLKVHESLARVHEE